MELYTKVQVSWKPQKAFHAYFEEGPVAGTISYSQTGSRIPNKSRKICVRTVFGKLPQNNNFDAWELSDWKMEIGELVFALIHWFRRFAGHDDPAIT